MAELFFSGQVANLLGIHRDKVVAVTTGKGGGPRPSERIGDRNAYTKSDIEKLCAYLESKRYPFHRPSFLAHAE